MPRLRTYFARQTELPDVSNYAGDAQPFASGSEGHTDSDFFPVGAAAASLATAYLKSLLYGVSSRDPRTIAASCALLIVVALAASWLPARRAISVDPMQGLRNE